MFVNKGIVTGILFCVFWFFGTDNAEASLAKAAMLQDSVNGVSIHKDKKKKKQQEASGIQMPLFGDTIPDGRVAPIVDTNLFSDSESTVMNGHGRRMDGEADKDDISQDGMVVDEIVAVIGTKMVKLSDVEHSVESMRLWYRIYTNCRPMRIV